MFIRKIYIFLIACIVLSSCSIGDTTSVVECEESSNTIPGSEAMQEESEDGIQRKDTPSVVYEQNYTKLKYPFQQEAPYIVQEDKIVLLVFDGISVDSIPFIIPNDWRSEDNLRSVDLSIAIKEFYDDNVLLHAMIHDEGPSYNRNYVFNVNDASVQNYIDWFKSTYYNTVPYFLNNGYIVRQDGFTGNMQLVDIGGNVSFSLQFDLGEKLPEMLTDALEDRGYERYISYIYFDDIADQYYLTFGTTQLLPDNIASGGADCKMGFAILSRNGAVIRQFMLDSIIGKEFSGIGGLVIDPAPLVIYPLEREDKILLCNVADEDQYYLLDLKTEQHQKIDTTSAEKLLYQEGFLYDSPLEIHYTTDGTEFYHDGLLIYETEEGMTLNCFQRDPVSGNFYYVLTNG